MSDTTDDIEMDVQQVFEKLIEKPSNVSSLLQQIAYNPEFSALYADSHGLPPRQFLYEDHVYYFDTKTLRWDLEHDVLRWLIENAGREWSSVAGLYEYSRGIEKNKNPWLLFQYITGMAETSQGMGLNSLMGIGTNDAEHLGEALVNWSMDKTEVELFVELVLMYERMSGDV